MLMTNHKILLVDDDRDLLEMLLSIFQRAGYTDLLTASSGSEALRIWREAQPNLIVLDVMMPGMDGFSILKEIRRTSRVPVLMLTARGEAEDRIEGLEIGADDYLAKPFLPKELLLRVRAILRRTYRGCEKTEEKLMVGEREVDLEAGVVRLAGDLPEKEREIPLTNKEYHLLKLFLENRGKILTLDFLAEAVWGANYYGYENTLMVHIRKLREKIEENPSTPQWLITVKGLGYRLNR